MDPVKAEGASYKFHAIQIALEHLAEPDPDAEKLDLSSLHCLMVQANQELNEALNGDKTEEGESYGKAKTTTEV